MFRAIVLSIAVCVAVGPDLELLCKAWCHAQAAAGSECDHVKPAPAEDIGASNSCDRALSIGAFVREEPRLAGPNADGAVYALAAAGRQLDPPDLATRLELAYSPGRLLDARPLSTVLRI